ncbi:MAG: hypothetical protein V1792_25300 [Pseudomonadota bacterium]
MKAIDTESFFRTMIDNMLVTASWVDEAKARLGIDGVSQVWSEKPAWYLWLTGAPCVHHFQLETACAVHGLEEAAAASGLFSVKCYPYRTERVSSRFSFEEQGLIDSRFFDRTNTPVLEYLDLIPQALFTAGSVEFVTSEENRWALLTFESLDTFRTLSTVDATHSFPLIDRCAAVAVGEVIRDVPGRQLAFPLFDRLVSLYSLYVRKKPTRVVLTESPGFDTMRGLDGDFHIRESGDSACLTLQVQFGTSADAGFSDRKDPLNEDLSEGGHGIVFDWRSPCGCPEHGSHPLPATPYLNPDWWKMADMEMKSGLASTCGCDHAD